MNNNYIIELRERLAEELKKHSKKEGELSTAEMETIYKLSETIKALDKIYMMDGYQEEDQYSNKGMYSNTGRAFGNSYRNSYNGDMSYRGRGSYGRWPMSYDDAKFNMVHKLGDLIMCTEDEHTKSVLRNAINQLENM